MALEIIILSEVSQGKTNTIQYHLYVESKLLHKSTCPWNTDSQTQRSDFAKGEGSGGRKDW